MNTNTNSTIPTFNIKAFIVPNGSYCYNPANGNSVCGADRGEAYVMKAFADQCEGLERLGINPYDIKINDVEGLDVTTSTHWVQMWLYNEDNDNMNDHHMPEELYELIKDMPHGNRRGDLLPESFPESFLTGMKEGSTKDTIVYKHGKPIARLHWTFIQREMRYRSWGNFEEVLEDVLMKGKSYRKKAAA